jgi:hypothetical protein
MGLTFLNTSCRSNKATVAITGNMGCIINIYPTEQTLTAPKEVRLDDVVDLSLAPKPGL